VLANAAIDAVGVVERVGGGAITLGAGCDAFVGLVDLLYTVLGFWFALSRGRENNHTSFSLGLGTVMHLDVQSTSPSLHVLRQARIAACWLFCAAVAASVVVGAEPVEADWAAARAKTPV